MKSFRVKYLPTVYHQTVKDFPNFSATGSIKGMKDMYYGKNALLVKCGQYIYNVTSNESIYYNLAH